MLQLLFIKRGHPSDTMKLLCLLAFVLPVAYCLPTNFDLYKSVERHCPAPYFPVGHQCFYVNKAVASWKNARVICNSIGGDLAEPFNEFVLHEVLKDRFGNETDQWYWVGGEIFSVGSDASQWKWLSGRPIRTWGFNQPQKRNGEDCLMMGVLRLIDLHPIYDYFCNEGYQSICEM